MSLTKAIKTARSFGRKSSDAMPPHIKRLKLTITKFCHPEHFGKFYIGKDETKPSPKHANGKGAKFKDTFTYVRLCRTLEASKSKDGGIGWFHFYANRPDAPWWLLMLDIDLHADRDIGGDSDAPDLAILLIDKEFGGHWDRVWTATSRNGRGFYIYFLVANPALLRGTGEFMGVEAFAERLRAYNRYLKATYNDLLHEVEGKTRQFRANVDAVKGSPYYFDWNKFVMGAKDGSHWTAIGGLSKPFPPMPKLNNFGSLATMPLTGILAEDADSTLGEAIIQRFVAFCAAYREKAFAPSFFFSKIASVPISDSVGGEGEGEDINRAEEGDTGDPVPVVDRPVTKPSVPISYSVTKKRGEESRKPVVGDDLERMNKCASDLVRTLGRAASQQEILDEYHRLNLHTGTDDDLNRQRLARTAAKWWAINFLPCRLGGFNEACHVPLVQQHVTEAIRKSIKQKNRSDYTDQQVAVVLYCVERGALTWNKNPTMQFTCGNNSIVETFKKLGVRLVEEDERNKKKEDTRRKKLAAIKKALVLSGLTEELEGGRWRIGKSKCYGLGPQHPDRQKYIDLREEFFAKRAVSKTVMPDADAA